MAGLSVLQEFGVPFDLLINPHQLKVTKYLVSKLPNVTFNLNHIGYPNVSNPEFDHKWAEGMLDLADLPNLYVKLSGLPQCFGSMAWTPEDFRPYIEFILNTFPSDRINFAGNWFVDVEFSSSYA